MSDLVAVPSPGGRLRGVHPAVVTSCDAASYRVRLRFPWLPDGEESALARVLTPMAGGGRGACFLPAPGDQVVVLFEHGDIGRPIVVGGAWSRTEAPPQADERGENHVKVIASQAGHRVVFDDTPGGERLTVVSADGGATIELDAAAGVTRLRSRGDVVIEASGAVRLHGRELRLTAGDSVRGISAGSLELRGAALSLGADGPLSLGAPAITLGGAAQPRRRPSDD
jgi:uncharacterized protein involved in type VI secretion and phage assembly